MLKRIYERIESGEKTTRRKTHIKKIQSVCSVCYTYTRILVFAERPRRTDHNCPAQCNTK